MKRWPSGRPPARESYLDMGRLIEAARASGAEAVHPGLRLSVRELALRSRVRGGGSRLDRALVAGDPGHGRQGRRAPAHGGGGCAGGAGQRGGGRDGGCGARGGGPRRLPDIPEGGGGRRWHRHGAGGRRVGPRGGVRDRPAPEPGGLRERGALRRALPRGPAPRRGAGHGRSARRRRAPARARVLDPAAAPEADRGDARARAVRRPQGAPHGGRGERARAPSATSTRGRWSSSSRARNSTFSR